MLHPSQKTSIPMPQSVYVDRVVFSGSASQSGVVVIGFRPPRDVRLNRISLFIDSLDSGSVTVKTLLNKEVIGSVTAVEGGNSFPDSITVKALDRLDVVFSVGESFVDTVIKGVYFSYEITNA